jgi:hypothetical protein
LFISIILPPNIAARPAFSDSGNLPFHDFAIMLQPHSIGHFRLLADSCDPPFHDLAIMLLSSLWALPPVGRLLRSALS